MANYSFGGKTAADFSLQDGTLPKATSYMEEDVFSLPPDYSTYTWGDMQRAEARGNERAGLAAGVGLLGSAAQIGGAFIKTAEERYNDKRLAELEKHKGLTPGDRADIDEQAMRPVKSFANESQHRTDDALASSGHRSAKDLYTARVAEKDALNRAAIQAADRGIVEHRKQVQRDIEEQDERTYEKGKLEKQRIGLIARGIADAISTTAKPLAHAIVKDEPTDAQLLWMAQAKDKNGNPLYPGFQDGMTVEDMRLLYRTQMRQQGKADGATRIT